MEIEEIRQRLDVLSEAAKSRRLECDGIFAATVGGADIDFMTPEEREERHQLTLLLPTSAEDREAAKTRIQQRIKQRKAQTTEKIWHTADNLAERRIVGIAHAQEWNDYYQDFRFSGAGQEVDVTGEVLLLDLDGIRALKDGSDNTNKLVTAEGLVCNGPHFVEVVDEVCLFFGVSKLNDITQDVLVRARSERDGLVAEPVDGPSEGRKALSNDRLNRDRLFSGVYPCGIVYADRYREKGGDYARLAFLAYDTLQLSIEDDCPAELRALIKTDAAAIQAKSGQSYQVSTSGQTVMLGSKAPS